MAKKAKAKEKGADKVVQSAEEPSVSFGKRIQAKAAIANGEEAEEAQDESDGEELEEEDTGPEDEEETSGDSDEEESDDEDESEEKSDEESDDEESESDEDEEGSEDEEAEEDSDEQASDEEEAEEDSEGDKSKGKKKADAKNEGDEKSIPLHAHLAERRKMKAKQDALEARIKALEAGGDGSEAVPAEISEKNFNASVNNARKSFTDFDEAEAALVEMDEQFPERGLMKMVRQSEDPGEAMYMFGEEILLTKKYGKTWNERKAKLAKELREQITTEVTEKVRKELKAKLHSKGKEPRNLSGARASKGSSEKAKAGPTFGGRLRR